MAKIPTGRFVWFEYVAKDVAKAQAKRLGATIMVPATDIPKVGRFSVFTDPLGGTIAILQPMPG
jgi:predicted enzyme related to lactoylglutathione lyase